MKTMHPIYCSIAALALMAGCETTPARDTGRTETLHSDSTTQVNARVGQVLEFGLPGNAGTGYTWSVVGDLPSCLKKVSEPFFKADRPEMPGSSGTTQFRFEMVEVGEGSIRFEYGRPWEESAAPVRWSVVDIRIGE